MTASEAGPRRERWDAKHGARDPLDARAPDPMAVAVAGATAPGRALDLAAGVGRHGVWLATQGWTATLVDFSGVALERAKAAADRAGVSVSLIRADLTQYQPEPRSADLVLVMFLHIPLEERRLVYANAAAAVAPGGRLLIVGHDRSNLGRDVPGPQDPAVVYTAEEVAADIPGLVLEDVHRRLRDLDDGRQTADAVVVARRPAETA